MRFYINLNYSMFHSILDLTGGLARPSQFSRKVNTRSNVVGQEEEFPQIELDYLTGLVRAASHNQQFVVHDWQAQRVHGGFQLNSSIYRLQGQASKAGDLQPWSLVLKVIRQDPAFAAPEDYRYWKREIMAYQSSVLMDLTGPVVAPRCYDVCAQPDGSYWLFLEDIQAEGDSSWSLDQYVTAAYSLGEFNGAFLAGHPLPEESWVARDWLRNYLEHALPAVDFTRKNPHHPLVRGIFPGNTLAQILALWDMNPRLLRILEGLPQTFCHQDAFDRNLFLRHGHTVAIDWGYAGVAPVGSELTPLIAAAIGMGNFPASQARELDRACFLAYLEGLRQAGYQPDAKQVRLGFTLTFGLRYLLGNTVGETIPSLLDQERRERIFENVSLTDSDNVKSDPDNVAYYQEIVFELIRQLGLVFALRLLVCTLSYMARLRSMRKTRVSHL
jgi:hypothetical protein